MMGLPREKLIVDLGLKLKLKQGLGLGLKLSQKFHFLGFGGYVVRLKLMGNLEWGDLCLRRLSKGCFHKQPRFPALSPHLSLLIWNGVFA